MAAYLLGIQNKTQFNRDPLKGNLFENAVLLELQKYQFNRGLDPSLFYYRDVQKNEIDVLYKKGHELIPIEIKSSKTFHTEFIKKLELFQTIAKNRVNKSFVIYSGEIEQRIRSTHILNFANAKQVFN